MRAMEPEEYSKGLMSPPTYPVRYPEWDLIENPSTYGLYRPRGEEDITSIERIRDLASFGEPPAAPPGANPPSERGLPPYLKWRTRGRRSSRGLPSWQAAQPTRSGRRPNKTKTRSARLGAARNPRSVRKPLGEAGSRAADGATRPLPPRRRMRRASLRQSSYVDTLPSSVAEFSRGRVRGGRGSSIDQRDLAIPGRSAGSVMPSCRRNSAQAPSAVSAQ